MSSNPYEIERWGSEQEPTAEFLMRMLSREGLEAEPLQLAAGSRTPEIKYDRHLVNVLVSGALQYSFPGYGVIEIAPGDILEIHPRILHDIIVKGSEDAMLLQAFRA